MNPIAHYLNATGLTQAEFARRIGVSQSQVYQFLNDIRPVSEKVCVRIEERTNGELSRKHLRPHDWADIWPELRRSPLSPSPQERANV
ncbi:helix-turn-helix domain-containing protein [Alcaligenes faecalis subsp. faecalis]|uniref:transcriptional regulator n=1 Tax=Alcaligenes faecalis TaxID=511 RepID=UPI001F1C3732|nr:YdaS family helix-turn-helix protein [Alcaligenes faecalis]MBW4789150.1 helix-turn-helix domain-containing protein [Alcaligenes faecalis subsp. faecalis]